MLQENDRERGTNILINSHILTQVCLSSQLGKLQSKNLVNLFINYGCNKSLIGKHILKKWIPNEMFSELGYINGFVCALRWMF